MELTAAQKTIIKTEINADPLLSAQPNNSDGAFAIAVALNAQAVPVYIVWRMKVSDNEIMSNGFIFSVVDQLSAGKARIWEWMTRYGTINPSKPNVRQGLDECFGAASAMMTQIRPHLKRNATRLEKLLAIGTGTDAVPATMSVEGAISYNDVFESRNS